MKFSEKIEDGTSNKPLNFGSNVCVLGRGLHSPSVSSYYYYDLRKKIMFSSALVCLLVCQFVVC